MCCHPYQSFPLKIVLLFSASVSLPGEEPLPDPLVFNDGRRVETKEDWQRRRSEIREILLEIEYGTIPPAPANWSAVTTSEKEAFNGKAIDRRITLTFGDGDDAFTMRAGFLIPNRPGKFAAVTKNDVAIGQVSISELLIERGCIVADARGDQ